jgi:hypothetical protein
MNFSEQIKKNLKKLEEIQKKNDDDNGCKEEKSSDNEIHSKYTVEEPKEFDFFKRSLKRSYEESNRILIEEIEDFSNSSNDSLKNYIVDEPIANTSSKRDSSCKKSNDYQIQEVEETESMDIQV